MSGRLSGDVVSVYAVEASRYACSTDAPVIATLAREVQDARRRLAAIRALPDTPTDNPHKQTGNWLAHRQGYELAMRQVKALLDGES